MPVSKRGYLIPDPIDPGGERCIAVFIPDDDTALYAFMGAYQFFTTWVAHDKDGTNSAALRAAVWARAYERTITEGLMCVSMTELQDLIDQIAACCEAITGALDSINTTNENMVDVWANIEVNNYADFLLNCIPCEDRPPYIEPGPGPNPDPINDPPVGSTPDEYYIYLCRAANYAVDQMIVNLTTQVYATLSESGRLTLQMLWALILNFAIYPSGANIADIYNLIISWWDAGTLYTRLIQAQAMQNDLVCAIYTSSGPAAARTAINVVLGTYSADTEMVQFINSALDNEVLNGIYSGATQVPENYAPPVDCESECGSLLTGSWYPIDEILGEDTEYVFTSQSLDNWRVVGLFTAGSITNLQFRAANDYDYGSGVVAAVSFTVDECTLDGSPDNCRFWQFGNPNAPVLLGPHGGNPSGVVAGESVLIYVAGDTPPAGSFDHTFTVTYANDLIGLFIFGQFTYGPPDRAVTFEITNFTLY